MFKAMSWVAMAFLLGACKIESNHSVTTTYTYSDSEDSTTPDPCRGLTRTLPLLTVKALTFSVCKSAEDFQHACGMFPSSDESLARALAAAKLMENEPGLKTDQKTLLAAMGPQLLAIGQTFGTICLKDTALQQRIEQAAKLKGQVEAISSQADTAALTAICQLKTSPGTAPSVGGRATSDRSTAGKPSLSLPPIPPIPPISPIGPKSDGAR